MTDFLTYDAKVAVLIVVFYMFYRLLLARETFHRVNRIVLLATAAASFILPLCVITMHETVRMGMPPMGSVEIGDVVAELADPPQPWWQTAVLALYIIGGAATLGHTLLSVAKVMLLIHRSEKHPQADGLTVCVTGQDSMAPFSWMHYIVMNRSDYEAADAAILAHERGHIRHRHSWDVLLVDLFTALQWFNPAMWMLRADLRAIHEYEADAAVLSQGVSARQYQYLLITKAASIGGYSIANGITHSTLKNRITMMLHKPSNRTSYLKLLALVPIVGAVLAVNAETVREIVYTDGPAATTAAPSTATAMVAETLHATEPADTVVRRQATAPETTPAKGADGEVFDVVEEMPQFAGGPQALFDFLNNTIEYPADAVAAKQEGRVIVTFVVDSEGQVVSPRIIRSVFPSLDAEALRVISIMPRWTPGKLKGKAVNVKYTVPVAFRLTEPAAKPAAAEAGGEEVDMDQAVIEVDGKVTDRKTLDETLKPSDIESMKVVKTDPAHPRIFITTKKK